MANLHVENYQTPTTNVKVPPAIHHGASEVRFTVTTQRQQRYQPLGSTPGMAPRTTKPDEKSQYGRDTLLSTFCWPTRPCTDSTQAWRFSKTLFADD
jgi:hypothetical protein